MCQHAFERDDQNTLPATPLNEFGSEDARFERFAETDCIGNEDALSGLTQGLKGRVELIGHQVHHTPMSEPDLGVIRSTATKLCLEIKEGAVELRTGVRHKFGLGGIQDNNLAFEFRQKLR
ncbi:MAG: hypothetical protein JW395_2614 [Nitrospira sp.]|nr:hypothetical protein [Nitrospira sp.]